MTLAKLRWPLPPLGGFGHTGAQHRIHWELLLLVNEVKKACWSPCRALSHLQLGHRDTGLEPSTTGLSVRQSIATFASHYISVLPKYPNSTLWFFLLRLCSMLRVDRGAQSLGRDHPLTSAKPKTPTLSPPWPGLSHQWPVCCLVYNWKPTNWKQNTDTLLVEESKIT